MNRVKIIKADDITCTTEASIPVVRQTGDTVAIQPNTLNVWGRATSLSLTLATPDSTLDMNVYMAQFTSGKTPTVLTLPDNLLWLSSPVINADRIYRLTIINNLATIEEWIPSAEPNIIIATYKASTRYATRLLGSAFNIGQVKKMFIDDVEVTPVDSHSFTTEGLHTVRYEMDDASFTSCYRMFHTCSDLVAVDFSKFSTSNVTNMSGMFYLSYGLTELDLSNFDTSKVTDMSYMFDSCRFTDLDLSNFDTSSVTDMRYMFDGCASLTELNLSSFDTSKVTDMTRMFLSCYSLTSLKPFYNWKVNVTLDECSISAEDVHNLIVKAAEGTIARTLTLNATTKANWQNSQYYQEDSATALSKNITIK